MRFAKQIGFILLAWALTSVVADLAHAQKPDDGRSFEEICTAQARADLLDDPVPGPAQLSPGRFYNPHRSGQGWDFFWYGGITEGTQGDQLFVAWYTFAQDSGTGPWKPVWYGATGEFEWEYNAQGQPIYRKAFNGKLWRLRQVDVPAANGTGLGQPNPLPTTTRQWLPTGANPGEFMPDGAEMMGQVTLFFGSTGITPGQRPNQVAAAWTLTFPTAQSEVRDCLTTISSGSGGVSIDNVHTGVWTSMSSEGWFWDPVFYGVNEEHHVLSYFDDAGTPRWLVGFPLQPVAPCNQFTPLPSPQPNPQGAQKALCMARVNGYNPILADQTWTMTQVAAMLRGSASTQWDTTGPAPKTQLKLISNLDVNQLPVTKLFKVRDRSTGGLVDPLLIGGTSGDTVVKTINLTRIDVATNGTPILQAGPACQVGSGAAGDPIGVCKLTLGWMTEGSYPGLTIAQTRLDVDTLGRGGMNREATSIVKGRMRSPAGGLNYPRLRLNFDQNTVPSMEQTEGLVSGDKFQFFAYANPQRLGGELFHTEVMTAGAAAACSTNPPSFYPPNGTPRIVSLNGLTNGDSSFLVEVTTPTAADHRALGLRLRVYEGSSGNPTRFIGEKVFALSVNNAGAINQSITWAGLEAGRTYYAVLDAFNHCGQVPSSKFNFVAPELIVNNAQYDPNWQPTETSDTGNSAVGQIPLQVGVDGGAASASVPIEVPPGRHGMQPSLSLNYSSRAGNGIAGMGWSLSGTSSIHRCPQTMEQDGFAKAVSFSGTDRLCLDGQRLMAIAGTYGEPGAKYKTEVDSYLRVTQNGGSLSSGAWFVVELKSGERQEFGEPTHGSSSVNLVSVIGEGALGARTTVLSWGLNRRHDRADNTIDYVYQNYGSGELLLKQILYTGKGNVPGDRIVEMYYQPRPAAEASGANDISSSYLSGALIEQTQRLTSIQARVGSRVVRNYALNYEKEGREFSAYSKRSLLRSVTMCAFNGSSEACVPRAEFDWQETPAPRVFHALDGLADIAGQAPIVDTQQLREASLTEPSSLALLQPLADLDGDGRIESLARFATEGSTPGQFVYDDYLVKFNANRTIGANDRVRVSDLWTQDTPLQSTRPLDLDNDGRAELWGRMPETPNSDPRGSGAHLWSICTTVSSQLKVCERKIKLSVFRWTGAYTDFTSAGFERIDIPLLIESGRVYVYQFQNPSDFQIVSPEVATYFADANGDGLPDLFVQRSPTNTSDPASALCPLDGMNVGGPSLFVYKNISHRGATPAIAFDPNPIFQTCMKGHAALFAQIPRKKYDTVTGLDDFDGDSVPDLIVTAKTDSATDTDTVYRFGRRALVSGATTVDWPEDRQSSGDYEVELSELGPNIDDWEGPTAATNVWLDINGDGLKDIYYKGHCGTDREFVRLNTARRGRNKLLSNRIEVTAGSNDGAVSGCTPLIESSHSANFRNPADIDSDGREEIIYPFDFAARMCTLLPVDAPRPDDGEVVIPGGTGVEFYYFCPEPPDHNVFSQPEAIKFEGASEPARPMYGNGQGGWDQSLYKAAALRFVELPGNANGPRFRVVASGDTGIVTNRSGDSISDLYGDGLDDSYVGIGCPLYLPGSGGMGGENVLCAPANVNTASGQLCSGDGCNYGPIYFPDGVTPVTTPGLFVSENVGTRAPDEGYAPDLPDLMAKVTLKSGASAQPIAKVLTWYYQPLSSEAGRGSGSDRLQLYKITANGQALDDHHFYFTSSMPVVDMFIETSGNKEGAGPEFGKLVHRYGYREAMYNNAGRGLRGFRTIIEEVDALSSYSMILGTRTLTKFKQVFPYTGLIDCSASNSTGDWDDEPDCQALSGGSIIIDPESGAVPDPLTARPLTWEKRRYSTVARGSGIVDIQLASTESGKLDETQLGQQDPGLRASATVAQSTFTYDAFGNTRTQTSHVTDYSPGGAAVVDRAAFERNEYSIDEDGWWINKLVASYAEKSSAYPAAALPPSTATDLTTAATTLIGYDSATRQPNCTTIYQGDKQYLSPNVPRSCIDHSAAGWESTTTSGYDSFGNLSSTSTLLRRDDTSAADIRNTTTIWVPSGSSAGYFPAEALNAAGHLTCSTTDEGYGQTKTLTRVVASGGTCGTGGLTETHAYDQFGRQVRVDSPADASQTLAQPPQYTARKWCTSASPCPSWLGSAMYREVAEQQGAPKQVTYFDAAGRAIAEETQGFANAGPIFVVRRYDDMGRQVFESEPSFSTSNTFGTYSDYDKYGRPRTKWSRQNRLDATGGFESMFTTYTIAGMLTRIDVSICNSVAPPASPPVEPPICVGKHDARPSMYRTYGSDGKVLSTVDSKNGTTAYWYDGSGNPVAIKDANNQVTWAEYDDLGRRTKSHDPNQGLWLFAYNGVGEVVKTTDARSYHIDYVRDALGRLLQRSWAEPAASPHSGDTEYGSDSWLYDTSDVGPGQLAVEERTISRNGTVSEHIKRTHEYDSLKRLRATTTDMLIPASQVGATAVGDQTFRWSQQFDQKYGRVKLNTWPGNVSVVNRYESHGYVQDWVMAADRADASKYLRRIVGMDAHGQPTVVALNNGVMEQASTIDPSTGRLKRICSDVGSGLLCNGLSYSGRLLDVGYHYDGYGDLLDQTSYGKRPTIGSPVSETFSYDELHRLISVTGPTPATYQYDPVGNFKLKSDYSANNVAAYTYGFGNTASNNDAGPNAVTQVALADTGCTAKFWYDNNGNMTIRHRDCGSSGKATEYLSYTVDNLTKKIGTITPDTPVPPTGVVALLYPQTTYSYDLDGQRYTQQLAIDNVSTRTTVYLNGYERDSYDAISVGAYDEHRYNLAPGVMMVVREGDSARTGIYYTHSDRLGSTATVSTATGALVDQHGFDAFGAPRNGDWAKASFGWMLKDTINGQDFTSPALTRRGFTGHEHMDRHGLIHMNGRAFDYRLGRFLSVDPFIQFPMNSQSLNAYSYILNNPLSGTDPTGYKSICDIGSSKRDSCFEITVYKSSPTEKDGSGNNGHQSGPSARGDMPSGGSAAIGAIAAATLLEPVPVIGVAPSRPTFPTIRIPSWVVTAWGLVGQRVAFTLIIVTAPSNGWGDDSGQCPKAGSCYCGSVNVCDAATGLYAGGLIGNDPSSGLLEGSLIGGDAGAGTYEGSTIGADSGAGAYEGSSIRQPSQRDGVMTSDSESETSVDKGDKQKNGKPARNVDQNKRVDDAAREAGLDRQQRRELGRYIEQGSRKYGENYSYGEILDAAERIKGGERLINIK